MASGAPACVNAGMVRVMAAVFSALGVLWCTGCAHGPQPEARAVDGRQLWPPPMTPQVQSKREADLAAAREALAAEPADADALIWVGRRLGYLGRFRAAIDTFTQGVAQHATDARFFRHRGHRYITVREFASAIADLERAAQLMLATPDAVEPDGQPNARNVPTGTLYFNVYYHLALARYLARDFTGAARAWEDCQRVSHSPDKLVATSFWHYLTLRRLGREDDARALLTPIRADLDVIENHSYHRLLLAFAQGTASEAMLEGAADNDVATLGNGAATVLWVAGERTRARALWRKVVATSPWPAFGHIAAEVELADS
jgi:tetratricopeptide (TPR) repeat protein